LARTNQRDKGEGTPIEPSGRIRNTPGGGPWDHYERWQRVLGVNLWGVVNGVHAFSQAMIDQQTPGAIVNTGSKQGITCPPGDTA